MLIAVQNPCRNLYIPIYTAENGGVMSLDIEYGSEPLLGHIGPAVHIFTHRVSGIIDRAVSAGRKSVVSGGEYM